jgi:CheY-like chemotaxis protein
VPLDFSGAWPADDRRSLQAGDRVALVVEDEPAPAAAQLAIVREAGMKGVIARDPQAAVVVARDVAPDAVLLRERQEESDHSTLPGLLQCLEADLAGVRVSMVVIQSPAGHEDCRVLETCWSADEPLARKSLHGALARARRLSGREARRLLVADGDAERRTKVSTLLRDEEFEVIAAHGGAAAAAGIRDARPDVVLVGAALSDMTRGRLLADLILNDALLEAPLVLYDIGRSRQSGGSMKVCTVGRRLAMRTVLSDLVERLDEDARTIIEPVEEAQVSADAPAASRPVDLTGRKALIIDDDIRNIFALTSALEHYGMEVAYAESAKQGIDMLQKNPDTAVALVDVMMPEIDGYDAIRIIRGMEGFDRLPLIAVTAKAMKGDREKCIAAGASDYLAKPVRIEQLLTLLNTWVR